MKQLKAAQASLTFVKDNVVAAWASPMPRSVLVTQGTAAVLFGVLELVTANWTGALNFLALGLFAVIGSGMTYHVGRIDGRQVAELRELNALKASLVEAKPEEPSPKRTVWAVYYPAGKGEHKYRAVELINTPHGEPIPAGGRSCGPLDVVRGHLKYELGLTCFGRTPEDDPAILETWA
jgi:hypothetical protein